MNGPWLSNVANIDVVNGVNVQQSATNESILQDRVFGGLATMSGRVTVGVTKIYATSHLAYG